MNALLVIQIIGVLIIIGIIVYIVIKYTQFKKIITNEVTEQDASFDINTERALRDTELSDVIAQMNTINNDIYNTINKESTDFSNNINANQTNFKNIIDKAFNYTDANGNSIDVTQVSPTTKMNTAQMNAKASLSVNNLNTTGNVKICSLPKPSTSYSPSAAKCIDFSNDRNNLYLTDIGKTPGAIMLDGKKGVLNNNDLSVRGNISINTPCGDTSGQISSPYHSTVSLSTNKLGIGSGQCSTTSPRATLSINSANDKTALLKLSNTHRNKILTVSSSNELIMFRDNNNYSIIKPTINSSTKKRGIKLLANKVNIIGNLIVKGTITSNLSDGDSADITAPSVNFVSRISSSPSPSYDFGSSLNAIKKNC